MKTVNLYSKRFSISRGWHWKLERVCNKDVASNWLKVFTKDEPMIEFKLATKQPK